MLAAILVQLHPKNLVLNAVYGFGLYLICTIAYHLIF